MLSHLNHDAGEGETEDDKDEADEKPEQAGIILDLASFYVFFLQSAVCMYFLGTWEVSGTCDQPLRSG